MQPAGPGAPGDAQTARSTTATPSLNTRPSPAPDACTAGASADADVGASTGVDTGMAGANSAGAGASASGNASAAAPASALRWPEPTEPMPSAWITEAIVTGGSKRTSSELYAVIKPLSLACPYEFRFRNMNNKTGEPEFFTHVCMIETEPGHRCHKRLKFQHSAGGRGFSTTVGHEHIKQRHEVEVNAPLAAVRAAAAHAGKVNIMQAAAMMSGGASGAAVQGGRTTGLQQSTLDKYKLTRNQKQIATQARFYIYVNMRVSKNVFENPLMYDMIAAGDEGAQKSVMLTRKQLVYYVEAETKIFELLLKFTIEDKHEQSFGNPFAQLIHDGGTLDNKKKYQAIGLQFVSPDWDENHVVAVGFELSRVNTDVIVADLLQSRIESLFGFPFSEICSASVQDVAACGVSKVLELAEDDREIDKCMLHQSDKLARSALGDVTRSKNKVVINPFPEGQQLMNKMHKLAVHFSYGDRLSELHQCAALVKAPQLTLKVDLNTTRVASRESLLESLLLMKEPIKVYNVKSATAKDLDHVTDEEWATVREFEGVLNITGVTTTLVQEETAFTGAFPALIKGLTLKSLRNSSIMLIDHNAVKPGVWPIPRVAVDISSFSLSGQKCLQRAILEGERRFCGNTGEEITSARVEMNKRELLATGLDVRTKFCPHLNNEERLSLKSLLREAHVDFETQHDAYIESAKQAAAERAKQASLRNARPPKPAQPPAGHSNAAAASTARTATPPRAQSALDSGALYDLESECWETLRSPSSHLAEATDEETRAKVAAERLKARQQRAKEVVDNWLGHRVDFHAEFPESQLPAKPDIVRDLMYLPVGKVYHKMLKDPANQVKFGFLPLMAGCSRGQIGALMAESFCERMLSKANLVMTEGNTLLDDRELKMLVILKMNAQFMTWARIKYADRLKKEGGFVLGHPTIPEEL